MCVAHINKRGLLVLAQLEVTQTNGRIRKQAITAEHPMAAVSTLLLTNPELHLLSTSSVVMTPMLVCGSSLFFFFSFFSSSRVSDRERCLV
jgi:hypothetical protein